MADAAGGGSGPAGRAADGTAAAAFRAFLDGLAEVAAGTAGVGVDATCGQESAEGHRHVLHLLSAALDFYLEGDPERPVFTRIVSPARKLLGDNPDAVYHFAPLRGDRAYRIRGRRGDACYLSVTVHAAAADGRIGGVHERPAADLNHLALEEAPGEPFELVLSPEPLDPQPARFVRLAPEAVSVIVRHYFETEAPVAADPSRAFELSIQALHPPGPAAPWSEAALAERLARALAFVRGATLEMPQLPEGGFISRTPNVLGQPLVFRQAGEAGWGAVDIAYSMGPYRVAPDEALLVEGRFPECLFANVVLWNRFMQTFDYRERPVSRNRAQTRLEPDGSFRMVIAHRDPGVPNWLDTEGHAEGTMFWRFLMPKGEVARPSCRLVPLASLEA